VDEDAVMIECRLEERQPFLPELDRFRVVLG
jgi:hypothetical protein